ncbi:hypothetical protein CWI58_01590, partial [Neisseria meningitidis]
AHGGEGSFAAGEEGGGAGFLSGRARPNGHTGGQQGGASPFFRGFAPAANGRGERLELAAAGVGGFFETRLWLFLINI